MAEGPFDLTDKVALVTGAGQGLGATVAEMMAAHGAVTILADIDLGAATTAAGQIAEHPNHRAEALGCDVSDSQQIEQTVDDIVQRTVALTSLSTTLEFTDESTPRIGLAST